MTTFRPRRQHAVVLGPGADNQFAVEFHTIDGPSGAVLSMYPRIIVPMPSGDAARIVANTFNGAIDNLWDRLAVAFPTIDRNTLKRVVYFALYNGGAEGALE